MAKSAKPLEHWQIQDAEALKRLFKERATLSQEDFGAKYEIGSQGMVWQYLNARRPLNIKAAEAFARGLGVSIADFSKTIAEQIQAAAHVVTIEKTGAQERDETVGPAGWANLPPDLKELFTAYKQGAPAKQEALLRLAQLPESEMATLLLVIQSIGAKYKT